MKKLLFIVLGIALFSVANAQNDISVSGENLTIIKSGGKFNKHLGEIGYKSVEQIYDSDGNLVFLECKGKGNVACPDIFIPASTSFERFINESIIDLQTKAYNDLKTGKTSGEYTYHGIKFSYSDAKIIKDDEGIEKLQYDLNISCQNTSEIDGSYRRINLSEKEQE